MESVPAPARRRRPGPVWTARRDGAVPLHDVHGTTRTLYAGLLPPTCRHPPVRGVDRQPRLVGYRAGTMSTSPTVTYPRDPKAATMTRS